MYMCKWVTKMKNNTAFARTGILRIFLKAVDDYYGTVSSTLDLPPSLLQDPMRLMPLSEMARYALEIKELLNDELFTAKACSKLNLEHFPTLMSIVGSPRDLFTALIRFNGLFESFQSGTTLGGRVSGKMLKWRYNTRFVDGDARVHDGIFASWIFIHILRIYHGQTYSPIIVHLPGSRLGKPGEVESIFSCDIAWNAKQTQVWFSIEDLTKLKPPSLKPLSRVLIDQREMLSFVDMPNPSDFLRCVYELINYSRSFGYPKLEHIASLLDTSPQQLQRKLQADEVSFSTLVQHQLLCNQALKMMDADYTYDQIAESLGFTNQQSFIKAFKRMHGLTPRQYQEQLEA